MILPEFHSLGPYSTLLAQGVDRQVITYCNKAFMRASYQCHILACVYMS